MVMAFLFVGSICSGLENNSSVIGFATIFIEWLKPFGCAEMTGFFNDAIPNSCSRCSFCWCYSQYYQNNLYKIIVESHWTASGSVTIMLYDYVYYVSSAVDAISCFCNILETFSFNTCNKFYLFELILASFKQKTSNDHFKQKHLQCIVLNIVK